MKLKTNALIHSAINIFIWTILNILLCGLLVFPLLANNDIINPFQAIIIIIFTIFCSGLLSSPTAISNVRKDYLNNKIEISEEERSPKEHKRFYNRWTTTFWYTVFWAPIFSSVAIILSYSIFQQGLTQLHFIIFSSIIIGVHVGFLSFITSKNELLKYINYFSLNRAKFVPYLWREYILPYSGINILINAALAYVIYRPGPLNQTGTAFWGFFMVDLLVTGIVISILVSFDPWAHAITDIKLKIAQFPATNSFYPLKIDNMIVSLSINFLIRLGLIILVSTAIVVLLSALTYLFNINKFQLTSTMIIKGLLGGIFAGVAAGLSAYWGGLEAKE